MEINAFLRINESIFTFIFFFKEDFSHVKKLSGFEPIDMW